jgi:hypothetical protein
MIVPLRATPDERFTVRWYSYPRGSLRMLPAGYAVFDRDDRITNTFRTRAEAEQHRNNIARIYARYGW